MTDRKTKGEVDVSKEVEREGYLTEARPLQTVVPVADIRETSEAYLLDVDMPGVDEKTVEVTFESDVLAIEGQWALEAPEGRELIEGRAEARRYRRTFEVSDRIDVANIKARVVQGVLHLTLPKRDEARRRKIEIAA